MCGSLFYVYVNRHTLQLHTGLVMKADDVEHRRPPKKHKVMEFVLCIFQLFYNF